MALPEPPFDGSCLCGSVQIHITAPPLLTLACHYCDCQKFTASAFSLTTMFPFDDFACSGELFKGGLQSSGEINWLFDVVAPDQNTTARVLANFRQVVQEGGLRLHPLIGRLVDEETLKKIAGQSKGGEG